MVRVTWAIQTGTEQGGFLGVYFFDCLSTRTDAQSGFTVATFYSRKDAERALEKMKEEKNVTFPNARVARVRIQIEAV